MPRVHLFEWEDQQWFPKLFRDFITDHLAHMVSRLFIPAVPKLVELMQRTGHTSLVDLCSGGGGPLFALVPLCSQALGKPVTATLTDLYPNLKALSKTKSLSDGAISYRTEPVNAMDCPQSLQGIRTLFTALHHFKPEGARKILAEVVNQNVPIVAFETQERSMGKIIAVPLVLFLSAFLLTPFVGRMTMGRCLFTYLVPLAPLFYAWDGAISCMRTYNQPELKQLTESLTRNGYQWEVGRIPAVGPMGEYNITYLLGYPSRAERATAS